MAYSHIATSYFGESESMERVGMSSWKRAFRGYEGPMLHGSPDRVPSTVREMSENGVGTSPDLKKTTLIVQVLYKP